MAPAAPADVEGVIDVSVESCNYFHNHIVSLSIGCLIELTLFIKNHAHSAPKKRAGKKSSLPIVNVEQPGAAA